ASEHGRAPGRTQASTTARSLGASAAIEVVIMTQRSLLSLASLVVAGVLAAPPTAAQCSPWSKWGMHRLAWSPGSELTVGSVAHGGAAIALEFAYDAEAGVVLRLIRHRGQRKDGTVTLFD